MKNHTQLTEEERVKIFELRQLGHGVRSIAKQLNRDKGTVSLELARNGYSDSIEYLPDKAHAMAKDRKYILQRKIDRFTELKIIFLASFKRCGLHMLLQQNLRKKLALIYRMNRYISIVMMMKITI